MSKVSFDKYPDYVAYKSFLAGMCPSNDTERRMMINILKEGIKRDLTEKQRTYIIEYFINGKGMQDIGDEYHINKATVCRTIQRGMKKLRRVFSLAFPNAKYSDKLSWKGRYTRRGTDKHE